MRPACSEQCKFKIHRRATSESHFPPRNECVDMHGLDHGSGATSRALISGVSKHKSLFNTCTHAGILGVSSVWPSYTNVYGPLYRPGLAGRRHVCMDESGSRATRQVPGGVVTIGCSRWSMGRYSCRPIVLLNSHKDGRLQDDSGNCWKKEENKWRLQQPPLEK